MINTSYIQKLLDEELTRQDLFLVEFQENGEDRFTAYIDGMENVTLKQCSEITRKLREALGETYDDIEITISSPGLDRPFKHPKQYQKNLNKSIEVILKDGGKITGKLKEVGDEQIVIHEYKPLKGKNKSQKPELSDKITTIPLNQIKQTTKMIIF
ncbi:MAG: hypothetical protein N2167_07095 [Flavobacteriales bacterium]|nr:hypothetical protein [Flavobacteriales bacterium]